MGNRGSDFSSNFMGYNGSFYHIAAKFFDLVAVSFYFIIGSLPILTMGASFSALYYAVCVAIRRDRKTVTEAFWYAYRINLKEASKIWLAVMGAMFILLTNIGILDAKLSNMFGIGLMVFYAFCCIGVIALACYAFPALSRFAEPGGWVVKLSLYLIFRHLPKTVLLVLLFAACYLGIFCMPFLLLGLPGGACLISSYLVEPVLERYTP